LSSLTGRDWSCFRNTVIITALSGVDVALSVGVVAGVVCVIVCVLADEFKVRQAPSTTIAKNPVLRRIAFSPLDHPDGRRN
jgi:hypothetical protein